MKKVIAFTLAAAMCTTMAISAFASSTNENDLPLDSGVHFYDADGKLISTASVSGATATADMEFDNTLYISVEDLIGGGSGYSVAQMVDKDFASFSTKKTTGSKFISSLELIGNKKLDAGSDAQNNLGGNNIRGSYIRLDVKPNTTLNEEKVEFKVLFKAKKDDAIVAGSKSGDSYVASFKLWLSNPDADTNMETGKQGVFKPESNDDNVLTWSDGNNDVAELEFTTDSDPDKFYTKLSTRVDAAIYEQYGDPANANLYFRYFNGTSQVPSTSRPELTLFNPYTNDEDDSVKPANCFIYLANGTDLTDVTSTFKWNEDKEGWVCKTRTLGNYIISDVELELFDDVVVDEDPANPLDPGMTVPSEPVKQVPNTGRW